MILKKYDLRIGIPFRTVFFDFIIHFPEKGMARIGVGNIECTWKQLCGDLLRIAAAHQGIHNCRVKVYHKRVSDHIVQVGLYRRAKTGFRIGTACIKISLHLLFTFAGIGTVLFHAHLCKPAAIHYDKTILINGCQSPPACLYPQPPVILV